MQMLKTLFFSTLTFAVMYGYVNIGLLKELRIYHFGLPFHATAYKGNTIANDIRRPTLIINTIIYDGHI